MAKEDDDTDGALAEIGKKRKKSRKVGWRGQILFVFGLFMSVVMLPSAIVVGFAMLPTTVAAVVDRYKSGTLALTVGAMNLAGATPFLLELWEKGQTPKTAFAILSRPETIVVMYSAAAVGYLIDWAMGGITTTFMVEKGKIRLKEIEKRQAELVERWGEEVTGQLKLDAHGFPVDPEKRT